jgi:hypothetical protein
MDAQSLRFTASAIEQAAATMRYRAAQLGSAAAAVRWRSPAARTFLARADGANAHLLALAQRVEGIAAQVRAHATFVAAWPK